jgi:hypothetical protein
VFIKLADKFAHALNNRELAIAIWIFIAAIWSIFHPKIRKTLFHAIQAFFAWKLAISYILMFLYVAIVVLVLKSIRIWKISNLPLTLIWLICIAFVMLFGFSKANDKKFFKKGIKDNFKGLVFLEFFFNLYVLSIWLELILVPIFAIFGGLLAIAEHDKEFEIAKKLINSIMTFMGLFFISYAIYMAIKDFKNFVSFENLQNFYLPIILTISFLPFVYLAALFAGYESLFIRLKFFIPDLIVLKYAKLKTIKAFNINLWQLNNWSKHVYSNWRFKSKIEVDQAITAFKKGHV